MKRTLKERIELLGLNYTREMIIVIGIIVLFFLGGAAIVLFLHEIYIGIGVAIVGIAAAFFFRKAKRKRTC